MALPFHQRLATFLGIALLMASLYYLTALWAYLIISVIVAFVGNPVVNALLAQKWFPKKGGRSLAAFGVLLGMLSLGSAVFALLLPMLADQAQILAQMDPSQVLLSLEQAFARLSEQAKAAGLWPNAQQWERLMEQALGWLSVSELGNYFGSLLYFTVDVLVAVFSISFISFYLLRDAGLAGQVIRAFTPDHRLPAMQQAMNDSRVLLSRYFTGLLIQMSVVAVMVAGGLYLLGVDYALTLGILAGIFNLIPYVGPYIGGSLGLFIALTAQLSQGADVGVLWYAAKVLGVFVTVQLTDNLLLQPLIFSKSVQAHPLEIFLVVLVAGSLFGLPGMLAAIPVYTIARVMARHFWADKKWVRALTKGMD